MLRKLAKHLGKVRFIFIFRDIHAITLRKQKALDEDVTASMLDSLRSYNTIIKFAKKRPRDQLFLSYEKILTAPRLTPLVC